MAGSIAPLDKITPSTMKLQQNDAIMTTHPQPPSGGTTWKKMKIINTIRCFIDKTSYKNASIVGERLNERLENLNEEGDVNRGVGCVGIIESYYSSSYKELNKVVCLNMKKR